MDFIQYMYFLQDGETALMKALRAGNSECIQTLLDKNANVNHHDVVSGVVINHCFLL